MLFLEFKLLNSDEVIVVSLTAAMSMAFGDNKLYLAGGVVEIEGANKEAIKNAIQGAMNQMAQMQAQASRVPAIDLSKLHV